MGISAALGTGVGQIPVGTVNAFAGAVAPAGWLLCAGQTVSRTTYSGLFLVIGTTYGAGDGSTTFALPDLRGRVPAGLDNMGGNEASRLTSAVSGVASTTLGGVGGDQRLQTHLHSNTASFSGSGGTTGNDNADHVHAYQTVYNTSAVMAAGSSYYVYYPTTTLTGGRSANHQHSFTPSGTVSVSNANAGSGSAENVQPTIVLNYIIRAS